MITIVADDHIPFLKGVLEPYAKMVYLPGDRITRSDIIKADGLITRTRTRCSKDLLEGMPVKFIATATIGYDHIDTNYCEENGIRWSHAPGCNSSSVKQYVASALAQFSASKGIKSENQVIGIIGVGNVGRKVARLSLSLGLTPILNDPPRAQAEGSAGFSPIEEILEMADIITLHVPLNQEGICKTYHLADEAFFGKLARRPLLINTSRGEIVDTGAVKMAIRQGRISGYVADVWEHEPGLDLELLQMTSLGTPHIAGYSVEGKANGTAACVQAASRYFGFGIDQWQPQFLPPPPNPRIKILSTGKTDDEIISEALLAAYNILKDDENLKKDPGAFEKLRNYYPIRREYEAFTIKLTEYRPDVERKLRELGFQM